MPEDKIFFDERVDQVYRFGIPLVIQPIERMNAFDQLLIQAGIEPLAEATDDDLTSRLVHQEIIETARSIRNNRGPRTVLHALLLEDGLGLGQIAGMIHQDPRDLELQLSALVSMKWVRLSDDHGLVRYSLSEPL